MATEEKILTIIMGIAEIMQMIIKMMMKMMMTTTMMMQVPCLTRLNVLTRE